MYSTRENINYKHIIYNRMFINGLFKFMKTKQKYGWCYKTIKLLLHQVRTCSHIFTVDREEKMKISHVVN